MLKNVRKMRSDRDRPTKQRPPRWTMVAAAGITCLAFSVGSVAPVAAVDLPDGHSGLTAHGSLARSGALAAGQDTITSSALSVVIDTTFPQALSYTLTPSGRTLAGGSNSRRVFINDVAYTPTVAFTKPSSSAARYVLTVAGVDLDGGGALAPRTVSLTYDMTVSGTVTTTQLSSVSGDDSSYRFSVRLDTPALAVASGQAGATISGATNGDEFFTPVTTSASLSKPAVANAFVSGAGAVGTIYTPNEYTYPYAVGISVSGGSAAGTIGSPALDYRFTDGLRSSRETALNTVTPVTPLSRVFIGGDQNADSTVDWQDGALWLRTQIPQMPAAVRDFFNGGSWSQVHGAFSGPGSDAANNQSFTVQDTTLEQLTEIQRQVNSLTDGVGHQTYEYVGWQGRGHDYGWPNINELPFNPALGSDASMKSAQTTIAALGGDLSFHLNMTDMTDISPSYLRNTAPSVYGNRSSSTGVIQYTSSVFGWDAYKIDMYKDVESGAPMKREDAFVNRFFAPKFVYQDVMLPYPSGGRTTADENYGMVREFDHWRALGTTPATEYFQIEKYMNGGFLFKNQPSPSIIEGFLAAGNTAISNTRNYATQPTDYIWGDLFSDNANTSNVNATDNANLSASRLTSTTFLYSLLNGYLAKQGLLGYQDDTANNRVVTRWGNGTTFSIDKASGSFNVTTGPVSVASGGDRFIPAYDGTNRILMYSTAGSSRSWTLPAAFAGNASLDLFELTTGGRSFVGTVPVVSGKVSVTMNAGTGYVLVPTSSSHPTVNRDLALTATISASSDTTTAYNATTHLWSGREFATIPASASPSGNWNNEIKALTPAMVSAGALRYELPTVASNVADGAAGSYWSPNHESARGPIDLADGNAWVSVTLPAATSLSRVKILETSATGNAVTGYRIQVLAGSSWNDVATGTTLPTANITFPPVSTTSIRLLITSAAGTAPRIAKFSIFRT